MNEDVLVDLVAFALGWAAGWWLLWRVPSPAPPVSLGAVPALSVIVPARNEERALPTLLASLVPQLGKDDEVIVVDDDSSDATAALAHRSGATTVPAPTLPRGWQGKTWACHVGVQVARGQQLLFLDADTRLEPGGLDRLRTEANGAGGLYSVQPWHEVPRPQERLALMCNLVAMMGTGAFGPWSGAEARRTSGAFGPCLATSAGDYRAVGGHASVRAAILDDLSLAERYRRAGLPVTLAGGRSSIAVRMYPEGLPQLVEGYTKNLATAARTVPPLTLVLIVGWLAALTSPAILVLDTPVLALACYLAAAVQVGVLAGRIGSFGTATAALYLAPLAVFVIVFAASVVATVGRRRVRWKGRELPARSPSRPQADPGGPSSGPAA